MKKIILMCLFGLVFSQTEVSQKSIDFNVTNDHQWTLSDLFPDYDLDWAIINLVGCTSGDCSLRIISVGNDSSHELRNNNFGNGGVYYYKYQYSSSTFFVEKDVPFAIGFGESGIYHDIKMLVTAEFPIEDTGYIEEGFDFCLHSGQNLVSFPCENSVSVETALPELAQAEITSIIGEGVASTNINGQFLGSLTSFSPGAGYWFKSNSSMCFNYTCTE